jgi:hypothetical protein
MIKYLMIAKVIKIKLLAFLPFLVAENTVDIANKLYNTPSAERMTNARTDLFDQYYEAASNLTPHESQKHYEQVAGTIELKDEAGAELFNILKLALSKPDDAFTQLKDAFFTPENVKGSLAKNAARGLHLYAEIDLILPGVRNKFEIRFNEASESEDFMKNIQICGKMIVEDPELCRRFENILDYCGQCCMVTKDRTILKPY